MMCIAIYHNFNTKKVCLLRKLQAKKKEHTTAILYPDHTFTDWQEASAESWEHEQLFMQQAASDHPWGTKVPQLLFRGNSVTRNGKIAQELQPSNELGVRVWDWIQRWLHGSFKALQKQVLAELAGLFLLCQIQVSSALRLRCAP